MYDRALWRGQSFCVIDSTGVHCNSNSFRRRHRCTETPSELEVGFQLRRTSLPRGDYPLELEGRIFTLSIPWASQSTSLLFLALSHQGRERGSARDCLSWCTRRRRRMKGTVSLTDVRQVGRRSPREAGPNVQWGGGERSDLSAAAGFLPSR